MQYSAAPPTLAYYACLLRVYCACYACLLRPRDWPYSSRRLESLSISNSLSIISLPSLSISNSSLVSSSSWNWACLSQSLISEASDSESGSSWRIGPSWRDEERMEETSLVGVGRREGLWRDAGGLGEGEEDAGWGRGSGVGVGCEEEGTGLGGDWILVLVCEVVCELGSTWASRWAWSRPWAGAGPGARGVEVEDGRDGGTGTACGVGRS